MATAQIITCDECGAQRGDSNHWFAVQERLDGIACFAIAQLRDALAFDGWKERFTTHICGADCLARRQSKWLAAISSPTVANTEIANDNPDGNTTGDAGSACV